MTTRRGSSTLLLAAAAFAGLAFAAAPAILRPDLGSPARIADWTLDGSGTWDIAGGLLRLTAPGKPGGPIRRPAALAILKSPEFTTVTLEADIRSTAPVDLKVRDVELIVGYQSPSRFYYVHMAGTTDAVHNGIFLVADADRRRLDAPTSAPQMTDDAWHRVRLERDPASGRIAVFVDGASTPALSATDTTIPSGRVGFASFDETGEFRNIVVSGTTK